MLVHHQKQISHIFETIKKTVEDPTDTEAYTNSCFYTVAEAIRERQEPTDKIILLSTTSRVAHALLCDSDGEIVADALASKRLTQRFSEAIIAYQVFGSAYSFEVTATKFVGEVLGTDLSLSDTLKL